MDRLQRALVGRYTLERELGRGGMSTVYLAVDLKYDRRVALKVLDPELVAAVGADRFRREIRITARLNHPNILVLLDSGVADNLPWYTMLFVEGESLRDRLERVGGQLPFGEVVSIGRQVAEAIDYAHAAGVVHRDIKPANILLSGARAWVADFGVARIVQGDAAPITSASLVVGTPHYMSPEQARGGAPLDGRSDVYSLGCVLYEMLAGVPPFTGPNTDAILARHALDPMPPVATLRPTVGPATEAVLQTTLAKSPADRFGTATEAVAALEASLRQRRRPRRPRMVLAALGFAAAALLAAFMLLPRTEALDARRVIVLPMDVRGGGKLSGEDAATALVNALNTTDSLIATVADPGLPVAPSPWPDTLTARLGRAGHARYLVSGRLATGTPVRIEIQVRDLVRGSVLFRETTAPGGSDAFAVARRVARAILPDLMRPGGAIVDEGLLSSDVPALAAYLAGERAYRDGDFTRAESLLAIAVGHDSAFAWAALRGAQAASWLTERTRAAEFLRVALRKVDSFPPRYAALAKGLGAYGLGQADSAVTYLRAALALDHRWAEAHMALGEVYFHYVPPGGYPFEAARAAFDSALVYDPGFAAPLFHAIQHAVWDADRPRADSLFRRFSSNVVHPAAEYEQITLMRGCLDGTSTPERWSEAVDRSMSSAVQAATWLVVGGLRLPGCARDGLEAIVASRDIDWRWYYYATVELASVDAALGNVAEVRRRLEQLGTSGDVVSIFLATSGLPVGDLADAALDRLRRLPDSTTTPLSLWAAGTWAIERGDSRSASLLLDRLARLDPGSDVRLHRLLQESLRARLTLMRGDTAAAIAALRRLTPTADQAALRWNSWEALPWERFRLAQLFVTRGRLREAGEVASEFDTPASFGYVPWLPASLLLREQVERRSGDAPYANELRRRYLSLTEGNSQPHQQTRR